MIILLGGCKCSQPRQEICPFTEYIVYNHREHVPWPVVRYHSISPTVYLESNPDTLVEKNKQKVCPLYNYFDSISKLPQSVSLDEKYSFTPPLSRHIDTVLAVVFTSENHSDTLALERQHYGGMSFHKQFFKDSLGHYMVFNIIKARDTSWARSFDSFYLSGHY